MAMDIRNWFSSGANRSLCVGRGYTELEPVEASATTRSRRSTWKLLWRKMLKEKRKVFENSCLGHGEKFPYDECSYAQNFDEGNLMWDEEPDGLSRSFSVRFSDPSRSRNAFLDKLK